MQLFLINIGLSHREMVRAEPQSGLKRIPFTFSVLQMLRRKPGWSRERGQVCLMPGSAALRQSAIEQSGLQHRAARSAKMQPLVFVLMKHSRGGYSLLFAHLNEDKSLAAHQAAILVVDRFSGIV